MDTTRTQKDSTICMPVGLIAANAPETQRKRATASHPAFLGGSGSCPLSQFRPSHRQAAACPASAFDGHAGGRGGGIIAPPLENVGRTESSPTTTFEVTPVWDFALPRHQTKRGNWSHRWHCFPRNRIPVCVIGEICGHNSVGRSPNLAHAGSMTFRPMTTSKWRRLNVATLLPRSSAVAATIKS